MRTAGSRLRSSLTANCSRRAAYEDLAISLAMWVVLAAGILGLWKATEAAAFSAFREHLLDLAREASVAVDPQLHARIRRPEQLNDPDYRAAVAPLRRIRRAVPEIRYLYTVVRSGEEIHFVL